MTRQPVPAWFWAASILLLLWSLAGVGAFASQVSMGREQMAELPAAQREAFTSMPLWVWAAYGVATVGALAAAICLLLRRNWAVPLYAISLVAVIIQFSWTFAVARLHESLGAEAAIFPAFIIVMAAMSLWFARFAGKRGLLA